MSAVIETAFAADDLPNAHAVLDALVWQSLTTTHARFAEGGDLARRYDPEVAGFVAIADGSPAAWRALAELVGPNLSVILSGAVVEPPPDWTREGGGHGFQMILDPADARSPHDERIVPL